MCTKHFRTEQWDYTFGIVCLIIYGFAVLFYLFRIKDFLDLSANTRESSVQWQMHHELFECKHTQRTHIFSIYAPESVFANTKKKLPWCWISMVSTGDFIFIFVVHYTIKCCSLNCSRNFTNNFSVCIMAFCPIICFSFFFFFFASSYPKGWQGSMILFEKWQPNIVQWVYDSSLFHFGKKLSKCSIYSMFAWCVYALFKNVFEKKKLKKKLIKKTQNYCSERYLLAARI